MRLNLGTALQVLFFLLCSRYLVARAEPEVQLESFVPRPSALTAVPENYFRMNSSNLPTLPTEELQQMRSSFGAEIAHSSVVLHEVLYLLEGLHAKVSHFVERKGTAALMQAVAEKRDMTSINFEPVGIGKAELKSIGSGEQARLITTVRHNSGHYFIFADRTELDPKAVEALPFFKGLSPEQRAEEVELRANLSAVMQMMSANMLLDGKRSYPYEPVASVSEDPRMEALQRAAEMESRPLQERYVLVSEKLSRGEISAAVRQSLEEERTSLELDLAAKMANRNNVLSRMAHGLVVKLGETQMAKGYDVTMVLHNFGAGIDEVRTESRPSFLSFRWWKIYWASIFEKPHIRWDLLQSNSFWKKIQILSKGDLALVQFTTASQIGLCLIGSYLSGMDPSLMVLNTTAWALGIGIVVKTFGNWVRKGNLLSRSMKNAATGAGFGYTQHLLEMMFGVDSGISVQEHAQIWLTQALKGQVKSGTQDIPRFRARSGESSGSLKIGDYDLEIRRTDFEMQIVQLTLFLPKLLSVFLPNGIGIPIYMMMGPLGKLYHVHGVENYVRRFEAEMEQRARDLGPQDESLAMLRRYQEEAVSERREWERMRVV
ncbi:MAG: hypothetical protein WCH11_06310, partial [Bdellovibrio sp.]